MSKIIDVIRKTHYGNDHYYIVLDEMPSFVFERNGFRLLAEHDGFAECYGYDPPSPGFQAFGGREFEIPLKDGGVERANGQWWFCSPSIEYKQVAISTLEKLNRCYVFEACHIAAEKLSEWLEHNEPSTDYYKYRTVAAQP